MLKLKNAEDFSAVFNFRKRLISPHIYLHYAPNSKLHPRLGYVISSKIEKFAVKRNYMRRSLREIFKAHLSFKISYDIVVRVHKSYYKKEFKNIEKEIKDLIKDLPL